MGLRDPATDEGTSFGEPASRSQHGYVKTAMRSVVKSALKRCEKLGREPPKWCEKAGFEALGL